MNVRALLVVLGALLAFARPGSAGQTPAITRRAVDVFERLPVQDGGRVKPIASYARFTLLRVSGTTSPKDAEGERDEAARWLLKLMLYPEIARDDPVILVEDSQALVAVGVADAEHKKRDRWTYASLTPVLPDLLDRAHAAEGIDAKLRTSIQAQTVRVAESAITTLRLGRTFDFARHRIPLQEGTRVAAIFQSRDDASVADVIESSVRIVALERELAPTDDAREKGAITALWRFATELCADAQVFAWIPPIGDVEKHPDWLTPADLLVAARQGESIEGAHVGLLRAAEEVVARRTDPVQLESALGTLLARVESLALARGELANIDLEVAYQRAAPLRWSIVAFVVGFALCAIGWMRARGTWIARSAWTAAGIGVALLVAAIAMRCWIRGRPPVSTLYETVLFISATAALVALVVERIQRQRIHLAVACLIGAGGLFLANGYEALDGQDTMPSLVAVLDTNFWLATHVTAITLGYSAGLLAAVLGSAYVGIALVRGARADAARQRSLARSVYGVTCFALCFAVVGTILGGIWANESWGRFWGWDPKENGALLICISQIALVHARRAGMLRDLGTCVAAAFGGTIVAFSWWGVNLLGVGLHSYGFTSGIQRALWTYYAVQWGVCALGAVAMWRLRSTFVSSSSAVSSSAGEERGSEPAVTGNSIPPALPRRDARPVRGASR